MTPKYQEVRTGTLRCDVPAIEFGRSLPADSPAIAALLARITLPAGVQPPTPRPAGRTPPSTPFVRVALVRDDPAARDLLSHAKGKVPAAGLGDEGYLLDVSPEHALVVSEQPAGAYYGVLKLLEMNTAAAGLAVPCCAVVDWPTMRWRGMHVLINGHGDLPDLETLITLQLPDLRINRLILEVNYNFQYRSHPEMADASGLTVEDCRRLKQLADSSYVQLIPMLNCLGHQSWASTTAALLKKHPEFDETPGVPADNKGIYCRSWCPSNPAVVPFVCDLVDELIDAFHATAFHVGMDEVFIVGRCPRCKDADHARLFAKAVTDLHAHLVRRRKVTMLMWADRLLDGRTTGYGEWEASENGTAPAIDLIPHDVVLCDWHYELRYSGKPATYPSVAYLQSKGFRVWPSGYNSAANARMLAGVALDNSTDLMVGYLATTWIGVPGVVRGLSGAAQAGGNGERAGISAAIREGSRIGWEGRSAPVPAQP